MTATINIYSRNFVQETTECLGYSSYLILVNADNGKYKVFEETDSATEEDTELEAVISVLRLIEKMNWNRVYIHTYPNANKWKELLNSPRVLAKEFKELVNRLSKGRLIRFAGRPDNDLCEKMNDYLERKAVEMGII